MAGAWLFVFQLVDTAVQLFLCVYNIITLSDVECDYLNATTCCQRLNKVVLPEMLIHGFCTLLLLFYGHFLLLLLNVPLLAWHAHRYFNMPSGNVGVYDPTEIHNRSNLRSFQRDCYIKLGFHLLCFFVYLYSMIVALIE